MIPICKVFINLFLLLYLIFPLRDALLPCVLDFIFDYTLFTFPKKYMWGFLET